MNEPDFDEFSRLWLEEGGPAETAEFFDLARRAEIRARLLRFADYGLAALIVAAVAVAFSSNTAPATLLFGLLLGTAAVWATWKRRLLHQSQLLAVDDREAMLDAAHERCRVELKQSAWGVLLFPLGILLAAAMQFSTRAGGSIERIPAAFMAGLPHGVGAVLGLLLLVLGEVYFVYRTRRLRAELKRLDLVRQQYRDESRRDLADEPVEAR